jgi:hypothetical protein
MYQSGKDLIQAGFIEQSSYRYADSTHAGSHVILFHETRGWVQRSQQPTSGHWREPDENLPHIHSQLLEFPF